MVAAKRVAGMLGVSVALLALIRVSESGKTKEHFWEFEGLGASPIVTALCADAGWFDDCIDAVQDSFLKLHGEVKQSERGLVVQLIGQPPLILEGYMPNLPLPFVTKPLHVYLGKAERLPYHVVLRRQLESHVYLLIHERSGEITEIDGYPVVSPSGHYFATASVDIEMGDMPNRLQVWSVTSEGPWLEWTLDPQRVLHPNRAVSIWGPIRPTWRGDSDVVFFSYGYVAVAPDSLGSPEVLPDTLLASRISSEWVFPSPR